MSRKKKATHSASRRHAGRKRRKRTQKISGLPMVVDNEPIWQSARASYTKAWTQMQVLEEKIDAYWRQDVPAYERWVHSHFGRELTELREAALDADDKKAFLDRVVYYEIRWGMSSLEAYARAKSENEMTGAPDESSWTSDDSFGNDAWEGEDAEYDLQQAWRDLVSQICDGSSCEREPELRMVYEMLSEIMAAEFNLDAPDFETFKREVSRPDKEMGGNNGQTEDPKKLYRKLARILHPDSGRAFSPREQRLWHQAQEAYKHGDSTGLEIVLSQLDLEDSSATDHRTVSGLRELEAETRRRTCMLEKELRALQRENCWGFTRKNEKQLKRLHERVARELRQALREVRSVLTSLEIELADLETAHNRSLTRKKRPRKSKRPPSVPPEQTAFNFNI